MRGTRLACLALAVAAAGLAAPDEGSSAPGPPVPRCNGGGCGAWFKSAVTVTWEYDPAGVTATSGCGAAGVSNDTSGATFTCTVVYGGPFYGNSVTVAKDSSPPGVSGSPARGPDSNGWYTKPVSFSFTGDDGTSGVASCTSATYSGPDGGAVTVSGSCTDGAGNTGSTSMTIKYDSTPPTVTGTPARPPDGNGWYNRPVDVAFTGTDAGSGVAECSPAVAYNGPDATPAKLVGQCRDTAGHVSAPITVELRYDGTAPARPNVRWAHSGSSITLAWTADKDVVRAQVVRAPGLKGKKPTTVYQGKARRFVDRKLRSGARYWYQVTLFDLAGNRATKTVGLKPASGIYTPVEGAIVTRPPLVEWSPVSKARFYNVQLWRGRVKVLTTWVRAPKLKLKQTWALQGARQTLRDGKYLIYVFPAFGTAKSPNFGKLLGQVRFVVKGV
ncbi:MAG TPA: hypothetical protein VHH57_01095 [Gaiella sp.]|nr:hypothetical protein [Gaiella sp.]